MEDQKNILFVSKFQYVLDETIKRLRFVGYVAAGADSFEDVREILRNSLYHLVVTDYTIDASEKSKIENIIPEFDDETKYHEHFGDVDGLVFDLKILLRD